MAESWNEFWVRRAGELRGGGMSQKDAMKQAGREWKKKKGRSTRSGGGNVGQRETKLKGAAGLGSIKAEIPFVVAATPDIAASWDIAEGILDYLRQNADPSATDAFRAEAAAAFARAKGDSSQADSTEYQMGQAIAKTLVLVMAHRGLSKGDFQAMAPPQLPGVTGAVGAGLGGLEAILGTIGLNADLDQSGQQGTVGQAVGGLAKTGLDALLDI